MIAAPVNPSAIGGLYQSPGNAGPLPSSAIEGSAGFGAVLQQQMSQDGIAHQPFRSLPAPEKIPAQIAGELEEAARGMEGLLLTMLLKAMDRTVGEGGLFGGSFGSRISREMFLEKVGEELAAGGGIGLAPVIRRQLDDSAAAAKVRALAFKL